MESGERRDEHSEYPVIDVRGAARSRGKQYAVQLGETISAAYEKNFREYFARHGVGEAFIRDYSRRCLEKTARFLPDLIDEISACAAEIGLQTEELFGLYCHEEFCHVVWDRELGHCVAFAVTGEVSGSGRTYNGETWDWFNTNWGTSCVTRWENQNNTRILYYGYPGLFPGAGMNNHGMALTWVSGGIGNRNLPLQHGVPAYALIHLIMQQRSLEDSLTLLGRVPIAGWFKFLVTDSNNRICSIEGVPGMVRWNVTHGHLARHDRYYLPEIRERCRQDDPNGLVAPNVREMRMAQLVASGLGHMDDSFLRQVLSESNPKCPINLPFDESADPDDVSTVDALFFSPDEGLAQFCRGPVRADSFQAIEL